MNELVTVQLGNCSFLLREDHDFGWLKEIGELFVVYELQDSGNLSFGVETNGKKRLVKYAGARTLNFHGETELAIKTLKQSVPAYEHLRHPQLVELLDYFPTGNGFAVVFDWFDGDCLHKHWPYPSAERTDENESAYVRFRKLPAEQRLSALNDLFAFHVHVEEKGYVAIDFYDGSILYNFDTQALKLCDIDMYQKRPFTNTMGRLWGSSRFMSPEEFELGAAIDGQTNVYNMGAAAFVLAGGERDRARSKWVLSDALYDVAFKAVQPERDHRYRSVAEFYGAWLDAQ